MSTYIGYIVSDTDCNPFKVFIPALNGFFSDGFGTADGFGANADKWSTLTLERMKKGAINCYQTSNLSGTGDYDFDPVSGCVTLEENIGEISVESTVDITSGKKAALRSSCPVDDGPFYMQGEAPAANFAVNYRPAPGEKTYFPTYMNAPGGDYTTLSIGTRVLVDYPSGTAIGYIISQIPGSDSFSNFLLDPRVER